MQKKSFPRLGFFCDLKGGLALVSSSCLSLMKEEIICAQEDVTTDGNGNFGPTLIWSIPSDAAVTHHEYDTAVDLRCCCGACSDFDVCLCETQEGRVEMEMDAI